MFQIINQMGGLFSRIHKPSILKQPKFVPMLSRYNPNTVRKLAIEVYLPPVLSNIIWQYFSTQWNMGTVERIYNQEITVYTNQKQSGATTGMIL